MAYLSTKNSPDALQKAEKPENSNILNTWLINPWQFLSSLKMHFILSYLRPHRVFRKPFQPSFLELGTQEIIKNDDPLKQKKLHIKYLMSFELANSVSSDSGKESCRPVILESRRPKVEQNQKSRDQPTKNTGTHSSEVVSHYSKTNTHPFERKQSIIYHLRNLNNWIKNMLIFEYINKIRSNQRAGDPLRVLDMCCGKGGDMHKYFKNKISHLICTDLVKECLQQCNSRYRRLAERSQSIFSAEFFACDCSQDRLRKHYRSPWLEHHLVSCQFALHYSFESYPQADCMIRNASECLQAGGFFIATIPNAYEIMRRLKKSHDGRSFGNEFYNIEFICDTKRPPLFGAKYLFQLEGVVDCSEFLVHFPTLVKLCRKHGLKLDKVNTFAEYFEAAYQKGENLLKNTEALQTVYYERDSKIEENFAHIKNFANKTQSCSDCYGTLSKPEWDVATLYLVCAFKKCKSTLDYELNPIYDFDS